jgi:DNA-binding LytR/AlgR family response regulator
MENMLNVQTKYLILNSRDELLRIELSTLVCFEADGNYTNILTKNKLKNTVSVNLSKMEELLTEYMGDMAPMFARIGKGYIINLNYVHQVSVLKQRIVLSDGSNFAFQINTSKVAAKKLKQILLLLNNK